MQNHYLANVRLLDANVARLFELQRTEANSPCRGTFWDVARGLDLAIGGVHMAKQLIEAYYAPESKFSGDARLLERARLAVEYSISHQYADGSIDLPETNFHDSCESAFSVYDLGPAYKVLKTLSRHTPAEDALEAAVRRYLNGAADAMVNLGFHTPNHRWAISASLAYCWHLLNREDCRAHIDDFLREGIDCDENGEYTERSAGNYNFVCNRSLLVMARELNMPELREHVKRNLRMILTYVEPDDTMSTINSRRQDMGKASDWCGYYSNFLEMAILTGDGEFAWVADRMLAQMETREAKPTSRELTYFEQFSEMLLNPAYRGGFDAIAPIAPSFSYNRFYEASGVARFREGDFALTIVKERPVFIKFQYKNHAGYVRMAGSFFARGQFAAQSLTQTEDGYELRFHDRWGYKRPLPEKPETSDWTKMDHSKRENVAMQDFDMAVRIHLCADGMTLDVSGEGCENIPSKLELLFEPNGHYLTENVIARAHGGDYFFQKGDSEYIFDDHSGFAVRGGFRAHHAGEHLRGTLGADDDHFFIAMTAFTPYHGHVSVKTMER